VSSRLRRRRDSGKVALLAALALDFLCGKSRPAGCVEVELAGAHGVRIPMNPFPPWKVLKVAVVAHRDERHLCEEPAAAFTRAADAPAACQRILAQPVATGAEVPSWESQGRHGEVDVRRR